MSTEEWLCTCGNKFLVDSNTLKNSCPACKQELFNPDTHEAIHIAKRPPSKRTLQDHLDTIQSFARCYSDDAGVDNLLAAAARLVELQQQNYELRTHGYHCDRYPSCDCDAFEGCVSKEP
ncbi:hypothetical protein LCGC14_1299590 [marine sediment metagenome]|uniref:Uncharacterized protein n=1 Tax=marine sediment metagenome TaxID=412755 RepID=A0A0F9KRM1_9ZZZZ